MREHCEQPPASNVIPQAFILAGGMGTRLKTTEDKPKPLYEIPTNSGMPVLGHTLDSLRKSEVARVVVSLGFGADRIREYLETWRGGFQKLIVVESQSNLVDSILRAQGHLDEHFYLLCADIFCDLYYAAFARGHFRARSQVSTAVTYLDNTTGYGQVRIGAEGVIDFIPKSKHQGGSGYADTGLMIASQAFLDELKYKRDFDGLVSEFFRTNRGCVHLHDGYWFDIGTPDTYQLACDYASSTKRPGKETYMKPDFTDPYSKLGSFAFTFRSLDAHGIGISSSSNFAVLYEASQRFLMDAAPLDRAEIARAALTFERRLADGAALAADDVYPITHGGVVNVLTNPMGKGAPLKPCDVVATPVQYDPNWLFDHVVLAFDPAAKRHDVPGLLDGLFGDPAAKNHVRDISALARASAQAIADQQIGPLSEQINEYVKIFDEWTQKEYSCYSQSMAHELRAKLKGRFLAWKPPGGGATKAIAAFLVDREARDEAIAFLREREWWAKPLLVTDGVSVEILRSDGGVRFTAGHRLDFIGAADLGQDWRIGEPGHCVSCAIEPRTEFFIHGVTG